MTRQSGWHITGSGPQAYERYIVPAWMGEWAEALVHLAGLSQGETVLDLACGTGIVARAVARHFGSAVQIVGVDSNEAMLRAATQFAEQEGINRIDWRQGAASAIPSDSNVFDAVLCQQGLQYFADRLGSLKEIARVMVPGGRLALSVWRSLECYPSFMAFVGSIRSHMGEVATASFHEACAFADRDELRLFMMDAGFCDIHIRLEVKMARFPNLEEFTSGYLAATPIAADIAAMPEVDRASMIRDVVDSLRGYMDDDGLAAPMECYMVTAQK